MDRRDFLSLCASAPLVRQTPVDTDDWLARLARGERISNCHVQLSMPTVIDAAGWRLEHCLIECTPFANGDALRIRGGNFSLVKCSVIAVTEHSRRPGRIAFA